MKLSDAKALAAAINYAVAGAAKQGGGSSDRGLGGRHAAYDIANEAWHTVFGYGKAGKAVDKLYPNRQDWFAACGFSASIGD